MGKKSALEENGLKEGSEEYEVWIDKISKLEHKVYDLHHNALTPYKCLSICRILDEFEEAEFEFTIGSLDYKKLHEFLNISMNILDLKLISSIIKSYTSAIEINPISYGYKNDDINLLIIILKDLKSNINKKNK